MLVVVLIALTNLVTFALSSRFQRMALIDEDDFDFNIYDSVEYSSSYTGMYHDHQSRQTVYFSVTGSGDSTTGQPSYVTDGQ